jgi:hypothetical protein
LGNSVKYNNTNSSVLESNHLWKYYQKKNNSDNINTPGSLVLMPNDAFSSLNNINFSNVATNISKDSEAFKKIQKFSKINSNNVSSDVLNNNSSFKRLNNLYLNQSFINNNSYAYGTKRQHNFVSPNSFLFSFSTLLDKNSFLKFFNYSLNVAGQGESNFFSKTTPYSTIFNQGGEQNNKVTGLSKHFHFFNYNYNNFNFLDLNKFNSNSEINYNKNTLTDVKKDVNPYLSLLKNIPSKTTSNKNSIYNNTLTELLVKNNENYYS